MTTIRLHDSLAREKRDFAPIDPKNVRMYVCGPTVYDRAHIGNARPAVVFDVLFRLLRHVHGADNVTYARNITDVDDKIMARAAERGVPIETVTAETERWFNEDMAALGCLPPTHQPRATEFVSAPGQRQDMVRLIARLIERCHAYAAEGHVLFDVPSFPAYGRLSGRSTEDMIAGARVEVAPYKRDPMDFVLWKPSAPDQPGWDSPWGRGRPGWHIECSAMAEALLGRDFDIHGGGADLMFPHHENEIAQSVCACEGAGFARFWLHNGMVTVDGRKMSKSLGNFLTVEDMRHRAPGEVLRLALLSTHYRGSLDWTIQKVREANAALEHFHRSLLVSHLDFEIQSLEEYIAYHSRFVSEGVLNALCDDLNTPLAIAELHKLTKVRDSIDAAQELFGSMILMGLFDINFMEAISGVTWVGDQAGEELDSFISGLLLARNAYRKMRKFTEADRIRDSLKLVGVEINDSVAGTDFTIQRNFDPEALRRIKA